MTISEARNAVGKSLGLTSFDGSTAAYQSLSAADQVRVNDALSAYIVANAGAFTPAQFDIAKANTTSPGFNSPLADESFNYGMFGNELLNNADKLTKAGGSILQNGIYLAISLAVLAWILPAAINHARKARPGTQ